MDPNQYALLSSKLFLFKKNNYLPQDFLFTHSGRSVDTGHGFMAQQLSSNAWTAMFFLNQCRAVILFSFNLPSFSPHWWPDNGSNLSNYHTPVPKLKLPHRFSKIPIWHSYPKVTKVTFLIWCFPYKFKDDSKSEMALSLYWLIT